MQKAAIEVLEVTTPDKHDRRKRGKKMILTRKTRPMRRLPASAPSHPKAAMA
jgi:hypothetical protein